MLWKIKQLFDLIKSTITSRHKSQSTDFISRNEIECGLISRESDPTGIDALFSAESERLNLLKMRRDHSSRHEL